MNDFPTVVYATIYPQDPTARSETWVARELIREYLAEARSWRLEVVVASAHAEALVAARAALAEFPEVPADFWHLETAYAGTRAEEISFCKEELPRRLAQKEGWDWLLFMDADVWTRIGPVAAWMERIGEGRGRRFIKVKYTLRDMLKSPAHTLGAYFHHRALLEELEYWRVIFPRDAEGRRKDSPDCLLHNYLKEKGCEKIVPEPMVTLHFQNTRDAQWYGAERCLAWPGVRDEAGRLAPEAWAGESPPTPEQTRSAVEVGGAAAQAGFFHIIPYSLEAHLADAYNSAIESVSPAVEWLLITDADVMILTPEYGHLISKVIAEHPEAGLITCVTNRIGASCQLAKEVPKQTSDLLVLRAAAVARLQKHGASVTKISPPCSGFFMLFRRAVWKKVGGFKGRGMFGVDWKFSRDVADAGLPILRMDGLLAIHYYRLDGTNATVPLPAPALNHTAILNHLADSRQYRSYLEIGVQNPGANYARIRCADKVGVDPNPMGNAPGLVRMRSDDFFRSNTRRFDLIFIDGDHRAESAARDIENALKTLTPGGAVVIHDALPPAETFTREEDRKANKGSWTGGVWEAVLRHFAGSTHRCEIVDTDWGVAVIDTRAPSGHTPLPALPEGKLDFATHFPLLTPFRVPPARWQ